MEGVAASSSPPSRRRVGNAASGGHREPRRTEAPPEGPIQGWVAQWQDLLKEIDAIFLDGEEPPQAELGENPKAFLASFEQVAKAFRWPEGEWATRLLPALCGEARMILAGLDVGDLEDYGKIKAAILQGEARRVEAQRLQFRHFRYQGTENPGQVYRRLRELCYQWLKPERHTKEQILELLILEQFLATFPAEVQTWMTARDLQQGIQTVALTEEFLRRYQEAIAEDQVPSHEGAAEVEEGPLDFSWRKPPPEVGFKDNGNPILITIEERTDPSSGEVVLPEEEDVIAAEFPQVEQATIIPTKTTMRWEVKEGNYQVTKAIGFQNGLVLPKPGIASTQESQQEKDTQFVESCEVKETFPGSELLTSSAKKDSREMKRLGQQSGPEVSQFNYSFQDEVLRQEGDPPASRPPHKKTRGPTKPPDVLSSNPRRSSHLRSQCSADQNAFPEPAFNKCLICGKIFRHKCHLLRHQTIHTGEKPYICFRCGKAFSRKDKFMEHERVHGSQEGFACPVCGQNFSVGNSLLQHLRACHSEARLNECSQCGKSFSLAASLKKHQKMHRGKELHRCPVCGKNFHWRSAMRRHLKLHERPLESLGSPSGQETASTNFKKST